MDNDSKNCKLSRLDVESGRILWQRTIFANGIRFFGDYLFVTNNYSNTCDLLDAKTGKMLAFKSETKTLPCIFAGYPCFVKREGTNKTLEVYKIVGQ